LRSRVTWAELCTFFELKFDLEQEGVQCSAAVQCHDRVFEMTEASSRRRFAVFFVADKAKIRMFRFDRRPLDGTAGYVSTPWMPFLSATGGVTDGFRCFYRLCRTHPDKLGLPSPPEYPALPARSLQLFLLRDGAGVKADVYRAERSTDGSKLVCKHFQERTHRAITTRSDGRSCMRSAHRCRPFRSMYAAPDAVWDHAPRARIRRSIADQRCCRVLSCIASGALSRLSAVPLRSQSR